MTMSTKHVKITFSFSIFEQSLKATLKDSETSSWTSCRSYRTKGERIKMSIIEKQLLNILCKKETSWYTDKIRNFIYNSQLDLMHQQTLWNIDFKILTLNYGLWNIDLKILTLKYWLWIDFEQLTLNNWLWNIDRLTKPLIDHGQPLLSGKDCRTNQLR